MKQQDIKEALEDYTRQNMDNPDTDLWPAIESNLRRNEQVRPAVSARAETYPATRPESSVRPKRSASRLLVAGLAGVTALLFVVIAWAIFSTPVLNTGSVVTGVAGAPSVRASATPPGTIQIVLKINGPTQSQAQLAKIQSILENRLKTLGSNYATFDFSVPGVIKIQVGGVPDRTQLVNTLTSTGRVEFVDAGSDQLTEGQLITTSYCTTGSLYQPQAGLCPTGPSGPTPGASGSSQKVYQTVITGQELDPTKLALASESSGAVDLVFKVKDAAVPTLQSFTSKNIGQVMAITLDGKVISAPTIQGTISAQGEITSGSWSTPAGKAEAKSLLALLQSDLLPVSLTEVPTVDFTTRP